ncbi:Sugar phosphatase YbiV [Lactobacillus johnsonii]|nr:Sugar phosphatase YbiV [Lactobacillus johnsonii]
MQDRDIKFVIASGNQYENILDRFLKANKHMYFVAENGALVAHGNEILQISDLSDEDYQTMLEIVEKLPYKAIVAGVTSAYVEKSSGKEFAEDLKKYVKKIQVVDSFNDIDDRIFKVSLRVPEDEMPKVLDKLREDYPQIGFVSGASTAIDMQTKGMNKAVGLEYLGKKLKIKSSEMVTLVIVVMMLVCLSLQVPALLRLPLFQMQRKLLIKLLDLVKNQVCKRKFLSYSHN